jgi:hypothetical protein
MNSPQQLPFPLRTVHLDFHTGPDVENVGAGFDPTEFARTFSDAGVDSVTLFAKCHHGLLYYDTERDERHPGLSKDIHLLEQQVEALHSVGIRTPIYLSVQCDEFAANAHPEWVALDEDLRQVKWGDGAYTAGWQILDMSSPYQDYLADQISEVIERFAPLDGLFLDMTWDQPSSSKWAREAMQGRGLDPADAEDRARYARDLSHTWMERYREMVEPHLASDVASGVWFNSRPKTALGEEAKFIRHVEIESLPSGGWGYSYFPYVSRFVRPLGRPTLSHTGRFYKSWGDNGGLKPRAALTYECAQILSQGMTSGVGDLLHPSGALNPVTYDLIGSVYHYIESCEPFVTGGELVTEVAVIVDPALGDTPGAAGFGTVRALQQLRQQFDILSPSADLGAYALVVIPETTTIDSALAARLTAYSESGGSLFISRGAQNGSNGAETLGFAGVEYFGPSPFSNVFIRPGAPLGGASGFDHVMYDRTLRLKAAGGGEVLASIVEPYFEREWDRFSGHNYTPTSNVESEWAAIVQNGKTITAAVPLLQAMGNHGAPAYRELIRGCLERLMPRPALRAGGPVHLESTIVRKADTLVVHLISFMSTRVADDTMGHRSSGGLDLIEDPFPLVDVPVSVRSDSMPSSVSLEPAGEALEFTWQDGYVHSRVTVLTGHAMLVLRFG